MMNRRGFLGLFGAASVGFVLDPERLLWRPGAKSYHLVSRPLLGFNAGDAVVWNGRLWRLADDVMAPGEIIGVFDGIGVMDRGVIRVSTKFADTRLFFTDDRTWAHGPVLRFDGNKHDGPAWAHGTSSRTGASLENWGEGVYLDA